ncbi:MAG TPA: hypothetical protein VG963_08215 [Polyangiaceae bacterium]|nr:hypothetical protein [Polyangiaceae bacterium]
MVTHLGRLFMTALQHRIIALLTLLVALLPLGAAGHEHYFCRMMSRVVVTCCCRHDAAIERSEARMQTPDCCVRLSSAAPLASPARREVADQPIDGTTLLVAVLADDIVPTLDGRSIEALPRAAPGIRRSKSQLFLEHCALLI